MRCLVSEVYFRRCHCCGEKPGERVEIARGTRLKQSYCRFDDDVKGYDPPTRER
jgi:hypothetical protein